MTTTCEASGLKLCSEFFVVQALCFLNTDYLISRAEATLSSIDKVKKGHADYLRNMGGRFASNSFHRHAVNLSSGLLIWQLSCCLLLYPEAGGLLRALTQFSHLAADTIINGSATAHMAPTDHADRKQYAPFICF